VRKAHIAGRFLASAALLNSYGSGFIVFSGLEVDSYENLTKKQAEKLDSLTLKKLNLKTSRAYHIKLNFQEIFNQTDEGAECLLKKWYFWATHSRLQPIVDAAHTIKRHWNGVLQWFKSRITNGVLEGINSLIQAAKARARGYRTTRNLIAMTYLIGGNLKFGLPT